jgi:hypothetical protein
MDVSWPAVTRLNRGRLAWALGWVLVLGCDGSRTRTPPADASPGDSSPADARDASDAPATRPAATGAPLPAGVAPARRILEPSATITGGGEGSCTHQVTTPALDRWCLFTRPGPGAAGKSELWVMNMTRAALAVPPCDGSSPACLQLTEDVWMGGGLNGPFQPYANRFFGDTLVFYADARSGAQEVHRGPAFAWRPDWTRPRRISSDTALECWGHPRALVAHCVEALVGDPVRPDSFELRAGAIADRDGLELPLAGRIFPRDREGELAWQAGFSPGGEQFAFSQVDASTGLESLQVIATAQLGKAAAAQILTGVQHWQIGNDGKRLFFVRPVPPGSHGLHVADFPSGANVLALDANVSDYFVLGPSGQDRGVGFISDLGPERGAFRLAADPGVPNVPGVPGVPAATVFTFEQGLDGVRVSGDVRFTAWRDPDFRVRIAQHTPASSCALNVSANQPAFGISFLEHSGLVFWTEGDGGDRDRRDGYVADPVGCRDKRRIAQSVYFLTPVGDRGLVFADEVDDDSQRTTLKYAALVGGQWPAGGAVRVHDDIDGTSVLLVGTDPLLLLFHVSVGPAEQQGTYLFGPVPF